MLLNWKHVGDEACPEQQRWRQLYLHWHWQPSSGRRAITRAQAAGGLVSAKAPAVVSQLSNLEVGRDGACALHLSGRIEGGLARWVGIVRLRTRVAALDCG